MKSLNYFLVTIIFCMLSACRIDEVPKNLLKNADFSEGVTNDWWASDGADNTYNANISDSVFSSPKYSASIRCDRPTQSFALWGQKINENLPLGSRLKLSLKIKTDDVTGNGVGYAVRFDNTSDIEGNAENFTTSQGIIQINGTFDWKEYELSTDVLSNEIKSVTVYLMMFGGTTGVAYFDDIVLKKLPE
jgi:hypothetical protein